MSEQSLNVDGHLCPECANQIRDMHDHHSDCPVTTNYWQVEYGGELLCHLCDGWLIEGDYYRMIPQYAHPDDDAIIESAIGRADALTMKPVCLQCSGLRLAYSAPVDQTPN